MSRTKTASRGSLSFFLDGVDVTAQSAKETQELMEETLYPDATVLSRTIFRGQHSIDDFLSITDAKLKDELSKVIPLSSWQQALGAARKESRDAKRRTDELSGMISLRSSDLERMELKLFQASKAASESELALRSAEEDLQRTLSTLGSGGDVEDLRLRIKQLETIIERKRNEREERLTQHKHIVDQALHDLESIRNEIKTMETKETESRMRLQFSKDSLQSLRASWNLADSSDGFALPSLCPTCQQPLGDGHTHLEQTVQSSIGDAETAVETARNEMNILTASLETCREKHSDTLRVYETAFATMNEEAAAADRSIAEDETEQTRLQRSFLDDVERLELTALNTTVQAKQFEFRQASERRDSIQTEQDEYRTMLRDLERQKMEATQSAALYSDLADAFGQRGVQSFILQRAVQTLEGASQTYLTALSDGGQRLELGWDASDRLSRRAFVRSPSGSYQERPLASLSGGQWRRCSLAMELGFMDLVAHRGFRCSLSVFDEPLTHLDRTGRSDVGRVLRSLLQRPDCATSTIVLILQDLAAEELEEAFDCIDEVVKMGGSSHVLVDEGTD